MSLCRLPETIRGKIRILFAVTFLSVCMLTMGSVVSLIIVRGRLLATERYGDLFNSMLEVRRFEKNVIFFNDEESLSEQLQYLDKVEAEVGEMADDIVRLGGAQRYDGFRANLRRYKSLVREYSAAHMALRAKRNQEVDQTGANIRALGKDMLQYVDGLFKAKREDIHSAILRTSILPFLFLGVFLLSMVFLWRLVVRRMLQPLAVVADATRRVARGEFTPVPCEQMERDEIHGLLCALNRMARELELNQENLLQARKMAALGTFTAGIAHELNNPLNNISLTAQAYLEEYSDGLNSEAAEMLDDILAQSDRASEIVRDLLDFSRTEQPAFCALRVNKVIHESLSLLRNQMMLNSVRVRVDLADDLPKVRGNRHNLGQVLMNLMVNAAQAMPEGGEIFLSSRLNEDGRVRVEVRDTGKGIAAKDLPHIFEPFYTTKSVGQGTGLGLAVTYSLIKRHGGDIVARSEPGQGASFSIFLPVAEEEMRCEE